MNDCNENCPMEPRIAALEKLQAGHTQTHKEMFDRLRALETENAVQNTRWKNVDEKLDELTAMVKELSGKAGKRWDKAVETVLVAVVTGVVCFLLGRVGL